MHDLTKALLEGKPPPDAPCTLLLYPLHGPSVEDVGMGAAQRRSRSVRAPALPTPADQRRFDRTCARMTVKLPAHRLLERPRQYWPMWRLLQRVWRRRSSPDPARRFMLGQVSVSAPRGRATCLNGDGDGGDGGAAGEVGDGGYSEADCGDFVCGWRRLRGDC